MCWVNRHNPADRYIRVSTTILADAYENILLMSYSFQFYGMDKLNQKSDW